jgi:hypothetical protein
MMVQQYTPTIPTARPFMIPPVAAAAVSDASRFFTVGEIADELEVSFKRVDYVIKSRRIKPARMLRNYRLFDRPAIDRIRAELDLIADARIRYGDPDEQGGA